MRVLKVTGDPAGTVLIPWNEAPRLPGYDQAFAILDGLLAAISGLTLHTPVVDTVLTGVHRVD